MWFTKLIKQFFFWIDKVVYNFISSIYDLLITIARTSVLTQADIVEMADRIYKLLAIFMIFKVTLSLITYVVNPDDFSDKSKGVAKLGTNVVISLAMLVLTPYIFNYAYQIQTIILEDNSLATLVFGGSTEEDQSFFNTAGDDMAYITMSAFLTPNLSLGNLHECSNLVDSGTKKVNEDCKKALEEQTKDNDNFKNVDVKNYIAGIENNNLGLLLREDLIIATDKENEVFIMDYKFIFSTVVGVVVILLLLTFCMDVAVRSIKLAFLQLIAPVPILSYVDPKSGKDGLFKKWYEMCFQTYLSLFVRLIALYFAVYIISKVADLKMVDLVDGSYQTNVFVAIFIIIGALMFAKQLPKILEGLGIKLDGSGKFTLNPLRKMEREALGGGILKKPNDMLFKAGKGAAMAPINGLSTLGKKTIAGIDSKRNGKGFKQGWDRTHGNLYNKFHKKLDEWAPDSAESRKNERLGREEVKMMNTKWSKGRDAADKIKDRYNVQDPFTMLNGKEENRGAYQLVYKNGEFIQSRMNLDRKDEERKVLDRISQTTMRGVSIDEAIKGESEAIKKLGGTFADELNRFVEAIEKTTDPADKKMIQATISGKMAKKLDDTTKAVSGLEKVHESVRKQNQTDALIEDSLKFVKYNRQDPTDPNNPKRNYV